MLVKKFCIIFSTIVCFIFLYGCSISFSKNDTQKNTLIIDNEDNNDNPYLSITYTRENLDNFSGREMVFYTYDINTKTLVEECVLPFDSSYATGVVSRINKMVYYSSNTIPNNYSSGNSLWVYDMNLCKSYILDNENHEYNDILLIDDNTLLVMMVTNQHPIMPVLFDLKNKEYIYMADVNNEPFIYTCGSTSPFYNYKTETFTCIYWNEEEERTKEYNTFESEIKHYISFVSANLEKDISRTFVHKAKLNEMNMREAVQISENEILVTMANWFNSNECREYYSLVFGEDETTFTKIDCPYPYADYVANLYTVDEGKTFYFYLYGDHFGNPPGVYSYDTENEELTPILLNDAETNGHYINFSIVGP